MSEISKIRDRVWEIRNRINAVPTFDPQSVLKSLVDEVHQLAGAANAEFTALQQKLEALQVPAEEPQHSRIPDFNEFKEFGGKLEKGKSK